MQFSDFSLQLRPVVHWLVMCIRRIDTKAAAVGRTNNDYDRASLL